ncbi:hypothetical protein ACQZV8_15000 [Magnetococcales bacterium HHB-1]
MSANTTPRDVCSKCCHANHGTVDVAEGRWFCSWLGATKKDVLCRVRFLDTDDYAFERFDGSNCTWGTGQSGAFSAPAGYENRPISEEDLDEPHDGSESQISEYCVDRMEEGRDYLQEVPEVVRPFMLSISKKNHQYFRKSFPVFSHFTQAVSFNWLQRQKQFLSLVIEEGFQPRESFLTAEYKEEISIALLSCNGSYLLGSCGILTSGGFLVYKKIGLRSLEQKLPEGFGEQKNIVVHGDILKRERVYFYPVLKTSSIHSIFIRFHNKSQLDQQKDFDEIKNMAQNLESAFMETNNQTLYGASHWLRE